MVEGSDSIAVITTFSFVFFLQLLFVSLFFISGISADIDSGINGWHLLTRHNFSYETRRHADILLMVTVPWSGESRALSEELTHDLSRRRDKIGGLRLMLMYRNNEKTLAEAIGATDGISIIFYHHSFSYKYRGRLRASNILFSAQYVTSLPAQELPIKHLTSAKEVKKFVESTDEAVLLLEFCDWTFRKLAGSNSGADSTLGVKSWKNFGTINYTALCGTENGFCENCFREFIIFNRTRGKRCTFEEYQNFSNFFSKFATIARDYFLPPEKQKFGLISDRSLLSTLEIGYSGPWVALVYVVRCHSCSKILRWEDDLNDAFSSHKLLINELEGAKYGVDPSIPTDKPSVVLFIDRTSESPRTRAKSQHAFNVLKSFILNKNSSLSTWTDSGRLTLGKHGHPDLKLTPSNQNMNDIDNKLSFMLINEGKGIILDSSISVVQGNSLQDVLGYIIQQRVEKLSSIVKKAGVQLLSNDIDIKKVAVDSTPIKNGHESDVSPYLSSDIQRISTEHTPKSKCLSDVFSENLHKENTEGETLSDADDFDKMSRFKFFSGYFFFSDGGFHLAESLTSGRKVPSVVIIDPVSQQHYVFPKREVLNYSSFSGFVDGFLSGRILPFERSESIFSVEGLHHPSTRPFFDTKASIPRISSSNFWDVVIGSKEFGYRSRFDAWKKDVLVLFSSSWCGFCQRMELVVEEVYFTLKGYLNMKAIASQTVPSESSTTGLDEGHLELPSFYIIDCTLNDCQFILRSLDQNEQYPSLLLFPSENKKAILYEGDIKTVSIMKFLSDHGKDFHNLIGKNGNPWYEPEKGQPVGDQHSSMGGLQSRRGSTKGPDIGVGSMLVATERLAGTPLFDGSVVLVVEADSGGFQGLIINGKAAEWDSFNELRGVPSRLKESPLSVGGPVVANQLPLTALTQTEDGSRREVATGVYYLDHETVIREIEQNMSFFGHRFFYGMAGWTGRQLLVEVSEGLWNVSSGGTVFRWP